MLTLAWETKVKNSVMKCLLAALADHHNKDTGQCNPSISRLAKCTCMNRQSVINNYRKLEEEGLISVEKDPGDGRGARSNKYTFHLGQSQSARLPQS